MKDWSLFTQLIKETLTTNGSRYQGGCAAAGPTLLILGTGGLSFCRFSIETVLLGFQIVGLCSCLFSRTPFSQVNVHQTQIAQCPLADSSTTADWHIRALASTLPLIGYFSLVGLVSMLDQGSASFNVIFFFVDHCRKPLQRG